MNGLVLMAKLRSNAPVALAILGGLLACASLQGTDIVVTAVDSDGNVLPGARVVVLSLSDSSPLCEVKEQAVADETGRARLAIEAPGRYSVAVELAGFLGAEMGPFVVEGNSNGLKSEAPSTLRAVLHVACTPCVSRSATNEYLLHADAVL